MDCMVEWDGSFAVKDQKWLTTLGMEMVRATPSIRLELMSRFVNQLIQEERVTCDKIGWAICAEVYANAMAMNELNKLSLALNRRIE